MYLDDHADIGTFLQRIGLGAYFLISGATLMLNPALSSTMASLLASTPLVFPGAAAQAVMAVYVCHLLIGGLLVLGLFTRLAGFLVAVMAIITMAVVNWHMTADLAGSLGLLGMAKDVVILASGVSLFFTGAKIWGVDCIMME